MIANVSQVEEYGGIFYLLDSFVTKTIYAFDSHGKFIGTVGGVGNGPGEYVIPSSFFIDEGKNVICIMDVERQKMIGYSLTDYHFLFEKHLPFSASIIKGLPDGNVVCYNQEYQQGEPLYNLIVTDTNFNVKKKMMEQDFVSGYKMGMTRKLYRVGNTVSAYTHQSPVLCRVKSDTIIPAYHFIFGNYKLPPIEFLKKEGSANRNYIPALMESEYVNYYEVFENEHILCVPYYVNKTMYYGWYDKQCNKTYNYKQEEISRSLKIGSFSSPKGLTSDGKFISLLSPASLKNKEEEGYVFCEELGELLKVSTEEDNPILLLYKEIK